MDRDTTLEQYVASQLRRNVGDVARYLRDLADEVERMAADVTLGGAVLPDYARDFELEIQVG